MLYLVNRERSSLRFTSVYRADAIVASGVRPWQVIRALSSATLHVQDRVGSKLV